MRHRLSFLRLAILSSVAAGAASAADLTPSNAPAAATDPTADTVLGHGGHE